MVNILIQKHQVEDILNKVKNIGDNDNKLSINNLIYYQTSFVHKSYLHDVDSSLFVPPESNERLEYLGDSFLGAIIANYLINRYNTEQEGFLTKIRTRLVRSSMLYRFARYLELGKYILLSNHIEKLTSMGSNKGRSNPRLYEDCFEAFIGAIIQDFGDELGYKYANRFITSIIEHVIDFSELILYNENFKDTLQRYFQSLKWNNPTYIDLYESGPFHNKIFIKGIFIRREYYLQLAPDVQKNIEIFHNDTINSKTTVSYVTDIINQKSSDVNGNEYKIIGIGSANKKNTAEQNASNTALCCLQIDINW